MSCSRAVRKRYAVSSSSVGTSQRDGLEEAHRLEGVVRDEIVEERAHGGQLRPLHALELHEVAPLGRLQRHALHMDVRVLLQVVEEGELAQEHLQHLDVHLAQLLEELRGVVPARGAQPGEHLVRRELVLLPPAQVHEGAELLGRGELDELGRVRQSHLRDGEVQVLRGQRAHQLPRAAPFEDGLEPLPDGKGRELPTHEAQRVLGVTAVATASVSIAVRHGACLPQVTPSLRPATLPTPLPGPASPWRRRT